MQQLRDLKPNLVSAYWYGPSKEQNSTAFDFYPTYGEIPDDSRQKVYSNITKNKSLDTPLYALLPISSDLSAFLSRGHIQDSQRRVSDYADVYIFNNSNLFKRGRSISALIDATIPSMPLATVDQNSPITYGHLPMSEYDKNTQPLLQAALNSNNKYTDIIFAIPDLLDKKYELKIHVKDFGEIRRIISAALSLRKKHTAGITYNETYKDGYLTAYLKSPNAKKVKEFDLYPESRPQFDNDLTHYNIFRAVNNHEVLQSDIFKGLDFLYLEAELLRTDPVLGWRSAKKLIDQLAAENIK